MNSTGKTGRDTSSFRYGALLLLCGLAFAASLLSRTGAQGPNGGATGPPPGGFGQGPGPGGFGQGPGGFRMPFVMGTVSGGDRNAGVITITSQFGGQEQTIRVNQNTKFATQTTVTASSLKVGDQVQVMGVPTSMTANFMTAGQMPDFLRPGGFGGRGPQGGPVGMGGQGGRGGMSQSMASASGKITSTSPLTISVSSDVSVVVKLASSAKISKISNATFATLKSGDRVMAAGQMGDDGTFTATGIGINMSMGGGPGFFGGPGGRGPGGGFGGPGGPGGPPPDGPGGPPPGDYGGQPSNP